MIIHVFLQDVMKHVKLVLYYQVTLMIKNVYLVKMVIL